MKSLAKAATEPPHPQRDFVEQRNLSFENGTKGRPSVVTIHSRNRKPTGRLAVRFEAANHSRRCEAGRSPAGIFPYLTCFEKLVLFYYRSFA
jgi:hypothetical protein